MSKNSLTLVLVLMKDWSAKD